MVRHSSRLRGQRFTHWGHGFQRGILGSVIESRWVDYLGRMFTFPMLVIARTVNKGQTENSALNVRVTQGCLFHQNLLVVIEPVRRPLGLISIRLEGLAKRGVLSQRNKFQWSAINFPPTVIGAVNIRTAHD